MIIIKAAQKHRAFDGSRSDACVFIGALMMVEGVLIIIVNDMRVLIIIIDEYMEERIIIQI